MQRLSETDNDLSMINKHVCTAAVFHFWLIVFTSKTSFHKPETESNSTSSVVKQKQLKSELVGLLYVPPSCDFYFSCLSWMFFTQAPLLRICGHSPERRPWEAFRNVLICILLIAVYSLVVSVCARWPCHHVEVLPACSKKDAPQCKTDADSGFSWRTEEQDRVWELPACPRCSALHNLTVSEGTDVKTQESRVRSGEMNFRRAWAEEAEPRGAGEPPTAGPSELLSHQEQSGLRPGRRRCSGIALSLISTWLLWAVSWNLSVESMDRMLMIIRQWGSSNWNEVPLLMKLAWRGKSDRPNKRVLMEQWGRKSLNLALICSFSGY